MELSVVYSRAAVGIEAPLVTAGLAASVECYRLPSVGRRRSTEGVDDASAW